MLCATKSTPQFVCECQHLNNLTLYFSIVVSSAKLYYLIKILSGVVALRKTEFAITHHEKLLLENMTPKLYNRQHPLQIHPGLLCVRVHRL